MKIRKYWKTGTPLLRPIHKCVDLYVFNGYETLVIRAQVMIKFENEQIIIIQSFNNEDSLNKEAKEEIKALIKKSSEIFLNKCGRRDNV